MLTEKSKRRANPPARPAWALPQLWAEGDTRHMSRRGPPARADWSSAPRLTDTIFALGGQRAPRARDQSRPGPFQGGPVRLYGGRLSHGADVWSRDEGYLRRRGGAPPQWGDGRSHHWRAAVHVSGQVSPAALCHTLVGLSRQPHEAPACEGSVARVLYVWHLPLTMRQVSHSGRKRALILGVVQRVGMANLQQIERGQSV